MFDAENTTHCTKKVGNELQEVAGQNGVGNSVREDQILQGRGGHEQGIRFSNRDGYRQFRVAVGDYGDELIMVLNFGKWTEEIDGYIV